MVVCASIANPHVAFVPFVGFRIGERRMLEMGMALPALGARAGAIGRLPALGALTLAGMTPEPWSVSYHESDGDDLETLCETVMASRPTLVAMSALTASAELAYAFSRMLRERGVRTVLGGLHATACADEALQFVDAVVVGDRGTALIRDMQALLTIDDSLDASDRAAIQLAVERLQAARDKQ